MSFFRLAASLHTPQLNQPDVMRTLIAFLLWCLLFAVSWPLALLVLVIFPFVWLLLLPFRIVGFTIGAIFEAIGAILLFPFRLLKKMTS